MANTFITPSVVAKLAYAHLYNTVVAAGLVFRDYDSDYDGAVGDTITVRKPASLTANVYNGSTVTVQDITESSFSVVLDTLLDVSVKISSKQWTLSVADFNEEVVIPAVEAIRQKIDALLIAQALTDVTQKVGTVAGELWSQPEGLIAAGRVLNIAKVPETDRSTIVGPTTQAEWLKSQLANRLDASGTTDGLRNAAVGRLFGFDTYMSQGIVEPAGSPTTGQPTTECNLAFHKSAFALVSRALAIPQGAAKTASYGADGVGIRAVFDYDMDAKSDVMSLDCLVGTKTLDATRAVRVQGALAA